MIRLAFGLSPGREVVAAFKDSFSISAFRGAGCGLWLPPVTTLLVVAADLRATLGVVRSNVGALSGGIAFAAGWSGDTFGCCGNRKNRRTSQKPVDAAHLITLMS